MGAFTLITLTVHSINVKKMSNLPKAGDHMTYQATLILGKCQSMKLFFFNTSLGKQAEGENIYKRLARMDMQQILEIFFMEKHG
jgi:hypothetical protein